MVASAATPLPSPHEAALDRLVACAEEVAALTSDGLSDGEVVRELEVLEQVRRRAEARQCHLANVLCTHRAARLRENGTDPERAGRRAEADTRRQLTGDLQWSPSDARRATQLGKQLAAAPETARRFEAGSLSPRHAKLLADTLQHLLGDERDRAEATLLAAAGEQDPVEFGRTCRRLLAQLDHDAAMAAEQRRHARRRASATQTEDGMLAVSGLLSGVDAETFMTALHAFRRPDAPGQARRPEQATADAMVEMARAALRAGEAPAQHGIRPHISVDLDYTTILENAGVVETAYLGPLPFGEVRRLLADAGISRLLVDPDGLPAEAGPETRNVPVGVWRGLVRRDKGCIADGCDAPPTWCDAMHLDQPYHLDGRLSLANAALGCRTHHRHYDLHGWQITWHHGRPVLHPPGQPPDLDAAATTDQGSDPPGGRARQRRSAAWP
jgi:hypothetical protein